MEVSHVNILSHLPLCLWNFSLLGFGESQRVGRDGGMGRVVVNEYVYMYVSVYVSVCL